MGQFLEFEIDKLGQMDRFLEAGMNLKLRDMIQDLMDRPTEERPRVFTLQIAMKPQVENGQLYGVQVAVDANAKIPSMRSRVHTLKPKAGEVALFFEPMSRDNPNQPAFPEVEEDHLEERANKNIKLPSAANGG